MSFPVSPSVGEIFKVGKTTYKFNGSAWDINFVDPIATRTQYTYTAIEGQTIFAVVYNVGFIDVYMNGLLLDGSDYVATSGSEFVLNTGASVGDVVTILSFSPFDVANAYNKTEVDTIADSKQDALISDINIKTVGGVSLLGSGDIPVTDLTTVYTKAEVDAKVLGAKPTTAFMMAYSI